MSGRAATLPFLLVALAAPLAAQSTTADQLRLAHVLYDQLELEQAARALHLLLSSQWEAPVETRQRVDATKLLGATLVLVGRVDSAVAVFASALRLDPFTDLTPEEFTPAQVAAFTRARRQVFRLAVAPVAEARVDPRVERIRFQVATTHDASIRAELFVHDSIVTVFESTAAGVAELVWDGLTTQGRLASSGRYELRVRARSSLLDRTDSASTYFDLRTETTALEDTLPFLTPADLLRERTPSSAGARELGKGLAIAGAVFVIAGPLSSATLGRDGGAKPIVVAAAGILAGVVAFVAARKQRGIPSSVAANQARQERRRAANEAIRVRNAERIAATMLVISPAAGVGP